ncbi:hypothetical protein BGZ51_004144 [Haplosporangium sp. Z 767]|nr:hypothetical protein BGZ51_004144 [Haplosporangium sp. Z 767]
MTCPPPSILSKSPSWDSQIVDTSGTTAEKKASFGNTVYSPSPLSPSSFWFGEKRDYDDELESSRTVMRRSIDSPCQSPLSLENHDDQTKGASSFCTPRSLAVEEMPSPSELAAVVAGIGVSGLETTPEDTHFVISDLKNMDVNRKSSEQSESWSETRQEDFDELSARARASARASALASQSVTEKPEVSYTDMISQAILESSELKLTLADIYAWIMHNYPYYRYSNSGWQNSIRNKLSLNKAFLKMERGPGDPGKGCFWALQLDALEPSDPAPCKKRKDMDLDAASQCSLSSSVNGSRTKGSPPPAVESLPSPAASEDAEDAKGLRRSGRARRPPRSKEAEDYVAQHGRHLSPSSVSLSTPPTSPSPDGQDQTCALSAASARKRMSVGAVTTTREHDPTPYETAYDQRDTGTESKSPSTAGHPHRSAQELVELASIPGVVTSQRVRRPPQKLAEFVSSEDFKTTPCATKHDRASSSSAHHQAAGLKLPGPIRSASVPDLTIVTNPAKLGSRLQPVTVPLSALSYTKRRSQSYSCLNSRKERHGVEGRNYAKNDSDSEGWAFCTQQEMVKRPRRDYDRELKEDREGDSSDSDFEFLRDEKENYRRLGHRIRRMQRTRCWRTHEYKDRDRHLKEYHLAKEKIRLAKDEGRKLLRDPTVINYGFDIEDGTYILDSHQGALFNSVTWPEFSDVKDDTT